MTIYTVTMNVEMTPTTLAKLFWEMNSDEQAEFFNAFRSICSLDDFEEQMSAVRRKYANVPLTDDGRLYMEAMNE